MKRLSTGDPATLGNWRRLAAATFGPQSPAVRFLDDKIAADPQGVAAEVAVDERQLMLALGQLGEDRERA